MHYLCGIIHFLIAMINVITKTRFETVALLAVMFVLCSCSKSEEPEVVDPVCVGIAWRADINSEFYTNIVRTFKAAGIKTVMLPQVKATLFTYDGEALDPQHFDEHNILLTEYAEMVKSGTPSNAASALQGIDAVVFSGGEDIAPTLYHVPQPWHGIAEEEDYNATRDVSDYLLMAYVIEHDIPMIGFCRGLQMLGVVSGTTIIQDIPVYYAQKGKTYHYEHRNQTLTDGYRDYSPHVVDVTDKGSLLYTITQSDVIEGVPSWHHQAIGSVEGTALSVTGTTTTDGIEIVEVCERKDKSFVMGLQYHPEAAVVKWLDNVPNASSFISYSNAMEFFNAFALAAKKYAPRHNIQCE